MKHKTRILALLLALLTLCSMPMLASCTTNGGNDGTTTDSAETETETKEDPFKDSIDIVDFGDYEGTSWINAVEFGFVADGKTLNDEIMAEYLKWHSDTPLYFENGVYCFEKTINFHDRVYLHLDPNAELKCVAKEPLDYFITLRKGMEHYGASMHDYALQSFIKGGVINANYSAKVGLGLHGGHHTNFQSFEICNVLEIGIETEINELIDGCCFFDNLLIYNDTGLEGTIGICDYGYDSMFYNIIILNLETGIKGNGTYFKDVSCWFNSHGKNLVPTSVFAEITGGNPIFDHPMVDTFRTGFKLSGGANVSINNMTWITNGNFYTDEMKAEYPMLVFDVESDSCRVAVNGLYLPTSKNFDFSNRAMPTSTFLNIRHSASWEPKNSMKNFRDDTEILLSIGTRETGNLTKASDFDALMTNGTYQCELRVGKDGKGAPDVKDIGVLEVEVVGKVVVQRFTGVNTSVRRVYDGTRWGAWMQ